MASHSHHGRHVAVATGFGNHLVLPAQHARERCVVRIDIHLAFVLVDEQRLGQFRSLRSIVRSEVHRLGDSAHLLRHREHRATTVKDLDELLVGHVLPERRPLPERRLIVLRQGAHILVLDRAQPPQLVGRFASDDANRSQRVHVLRLFPDVAGQQLLVLRVVGNNAQLLA